MTLTSRRSLLGAGAALVSTGLPQTSAGRGRDHVPDEPVGPGGARRLLSGRGVEPC